MRPRIEAQMPPLAEGPSGGKLDLARGPGLAQAAQSILWDVTSFYAVVSEAGPLWDHGAPMREQDAWSAHAAFMNALAEEGFIVLGGPLGDGVSHRAMLIVDAPSENEVRRRLADD